MRGTCTSLHNADIQDTVMATSLDSFENIVQMEDIHICVC